MLAAKDEALLDRLDALFLLDLILYPADLVCWFNVELDHCGTERPGQSNQLMKTLTAHPNQCVVLGRRRVRVAYEDVRVLYCHV